MIDPRWLSTWVQSRHLGEAALGECRQEFASHPSRLLVVKDFLNEEVARELSRFLGAEATFEVVHGLYSSKDNETSEDVWRGADEADRFFRFARLTGVSPAFRLSRGVHAFLRFRAALLDPRFGALFEALSGLSLAFPSLNVHAMRTGDFLKIHDDRVEQRRLAFVFYLAPGWCPAWGGALHMVDRRGGVTTVEAQYKSGVLFDVAAGTRHFIGPITEAAGERVRLTISGWLDGAR
jgi:hypothetical protein